MRDAAIACIRRVGVETGGSNVQFAVDPQTGRQVVIEMNPRVSRSSALASKATGFPIAKIAARLAVGYTLDEIPNDITATAERSTPAASSRSSTTSSRRSRAGRSRSCPARPGVLGTQMQSVGEVMAIGRTFPESLQKALRSLEQGRIGPQLRPGRGAVRRGSATTSCSPRSRSPRPSACFQIGELLRRGVSIEAIHDACRDRSVVPRPDGDDRRGAARARRRSARRRWTRRDWRRAKRLGFSDAQLAYLWGVDESDVRAAREAPGVVPTYKTVDTCAAEFAAETPYHYSTYEDESEVRAVRPPQGRDPRLRAEPDRAGHRVRLLLRARQLRAARRRLRDGDGQLQPRDRVDRLRHERPAVLRAAHPRGRAQRDRRRASRTG